MAEYIVQGLIAYVHTPSQTAHNTKSVGKSLSYKRKEEASTWLLNIQFKA
ncbi:hypothetical protein GCM10010918_07930 [Paenibacillus radicis (ex Gao et al. 2016)]|uniref:Uncharacterized protein n=1 Tax=Paenibacillus radicis (ex Gao et al. 2016) TaxID=1737354 RepID=A0A917GV21_9BACL|nr:hypothetical protein GCM10010918_07930 [Paenibacillus radicis (ex Gao et al. 2016)]